MASDDHGAGATEPGMTERQKPEHSERGHVTHLLPGRVRVKIPGRRSDGAYFAALRDRLRRSPGIESIRVNPAGASLLLRHRLEWPALAGIIARDGAVVLEAREPAGVELLSRLRQDFGDLDRRLRRLSGGELDLRSLAVLTLMSIGIIQLIRGHVVAPAVTVLWYAAETARGRG